MASCGNEVPLSENEEKGIAEIKAAYGGQLSYELLDSTTADGAKKYLQFKLSQSDVLEKQADLLELKASNVAWLFFKNIGEEKNKYTHLKIILMLKDKTGDSRIYSIQELEKVKAKIPVIEQAAAAIQSGNYDGFYELFPQDIRATVTKENLINFCSSVDNEKGRATGFQFEGFGYFFLSSENKQLLNLAGFHTRARESSPFGVFVDADMPELNGSLYSIKFEY